MGLIQGFGGTQNPDFNTDLRHNISFGMQLKVYILLAMLLQVFSGTAFCSLSCEFCLNSLSVTI